MANYVRIMAEATGDNPDAMSLYFDVLLDAGNQIIGDHPIFGFQGEIGRRGGGALPLVLYSDGRVDYGEECDSTDRFGELDLRGGKILQGRLLRLHGNGYDENFRITKIVLLAEG